MLSVVHHIEHRARSESIIAMATVSDGGIDV